MAKGMGQVGGREGDVGYRNRRSSPAEMAEVELEHGQPRGSRALILGAIGRGET